MDTVNILEYASLGTYKQYFSMTDTNKWRNWAKG